jgi:hypothetical protein
MWKYLRHPNVLPLLGVIMSGTWQFAMVSEWMPNGNINEFVKRRPDANRFELVGFSTRSPPSSLLADHYMASVAGRSREGPDSSAQSGNDPRGPQRGAFSRARVILSLTEAVRPIFLSTRLAMPAWRTSVYLQSYLTPRVVHRQAYLLAEAHADG